MSYTAWLNLIKSAEKTSVVSGKVRKIHYKFPDGRQMIEEYSLETGMVLRRAFAKQNFAGKTEWNFELGDAIAPKHEAANNEFVVRESNTAPILTKRITKRIIEWRIRNLPYKLETYSVTIENKCIYVRTTNKKYFKTISIPELDRCNISQPEQSSLTFTHQNNTLIISYKKPEILCAMELAVLKELENVETETEMDDLLSALMGK